MPDVTTLFTVPTALQAAAAALAARGIEAPRADAEWLLAHVLKAGRLTLLLAPERALSAPEREALADAVARRGDGEPLQHILGTQPFRGLDLAVGPDVLIPRPETEEVVDAALTVLDGLPEGTAARALDLGTGSGCIALALAQERPGLRIMAVDASEAALAVARDNARRNGLAERVGFVSGDLYAALEPTREISRGFHLIVSNPPYLTPAEWAAAPADVRAEPRGALAGGDDGLDFYRRIFEGAGAWLAPGGAVVVEIGWTQGDAVAGIAREAGFSSIVTKDLGGRERIVTARRMETA
jgi:release factor glutamine methyltransferase